MFEFTRQEKWLVCLVLISLLTGMIVKHYRQAYRNSHPNPVPAALSQNVRRGDR